MFAAGVPFVSSSQGRPHIGGELEHATTMTTRSRLRTHAFRSRSSSPPAPLSSAYTPLNHVRQRAACFIVNSHGEPDSLSPTLARSPVGPTRGGGPPEVCGQSAKTMAESIGVCCFEFAPNAYLNALVHVMVGV